MATYAELLTLSTNETLIKKIKVAVVVAAEMVRTENIATDKHAERMLWAKKVYENPDLEAQRMVWAVLAHKDVAASVIQTADDATVQAAVNNAVNVFATGA